MKKLYSLSCALLFSLGASAQCSDIAIPASSTVFSQPSGNLNVTLANIWICDGGYPAVTGNYNIVYMEIGATLSLEGDSNLIYTRGENYLYLNPGSDNNVVIHEGTGSLIANNGSGNTLFPCLVITYDYSNAPSAGCEGVGIVETNASAGIVVQPTLVVDRITISAQGGLLVQRASIVDLHGKEVMRLSSDVTTPIDLSALQAGGYFVRVFTDHGAMTQLVIKQ